MVLNKTHPYMGSKLRITPQLTSVLPHEEKYAELFLGSAAVYMNRVADSTNILCDIDSAITNMWRVVSDDKKSLEFLHKFEKMDVDTIIFEEALKYENASDFSDVDRAVMTYYTLVYSFDGNRKNMRYGGKPHEWNEMKVKGKRRLIENWEAWRYHASKAQIITDNGLHVLEEIKNDEKAVIMLDPPYVKELLGDYNKNLYRGRFSDMEQLEMLRSIQSAKAKIMLCGYRGGSMLYDQYLNKDTGWHCYCVNDRLTKSCRTGSKKGFAQEYIWVNYEIPEKCRYYFSTFDLAI